MASRGINKVILVGNLGADPETRTSQSGSTIVNLRVATGEACKDQQGQLQERTEWHRVIIFGKLADIAAQYLRKGAKVYLEGRLQTRKWQDKEGRDQYTTEIVANEMQMLDSKRDDAAPSKPAGNYQRAAKPTAQPAPSAPAATPEYDDDIPF